MKKIYLFAGICMAFSNLNAQKKELVVTSTNQEIAKEDIKKTDLEEINLVLMDYIEGTANGEPDRVRNAFHEGLNLYFIKNDSLNVWKRNDYIDKIEVGKKNTRQGKILMVDYEKDAAVAKIEILLPGVKIFTDYLMLLKIKGKWKIIHKSFTSRSI